MRDEDLAFLLILDLEFLVTFAIKELVDLADASRTEKRCLEGLLLYWPTVCTDALGQTSIIKHQIITNDPIPIRK
ncbi:uncharacterized protein LOC122329503 [Tachysurus ichikawai]